MDHSYKQEDKFNELYNKSKKLIDKKNLNKYGNLPKILDIYISKLRDIQNAQKEESKDFFIMKEKINNLIYDMEKIEKGL